MAGTLFVVATPIGNLEDITLRALRVLREVDLIAAEDTRRTAKLLTHYDIHRPMTSIREHNEARMAATLVARLEAGKSIALVSDAGTPGIADPGARLVSVARERGIPVVPVPGPSAVTAAISASGFALDEFVFMGFPPPGGAARADWLERAANEPRVVVFFEAPHRISRTLSDLGHIGKRPIMVLRELTKIHENSVITPIEAAATEPIATDARGEYVLVLAPLPGSRKDPEADASFLTRVVDALVQCAAMDQSLAAQFVAKALDIPERSVTKLVKKHRISVKQQSRSAPDTADPVEP